MLHMEPIRRDSPYLEEVYRLYRRAFPENERRPLEPLLDDETGCGDLVAFLDGDVFCGFAALLTWTDITHIIYFSIEESLRRHGCGTEALNLMGRLYPGHRYIADLEALDPQVPNNDQRIHRRLFYQGAGYAPTEVRYSWRGETYEILSLGGSVTTQEFRDFWRYFSTEQEQLSDY